MPDPRWRHKFRVTWATPWKVDLSLQWRYIAQVKADVNSSNPVLNGCNTWAPRRSSTPRSRPTTTSTWRRPGGSRTTSPCALGVNNIFDKDPPVLDTTSFPLTSQAGNTYPAMYDPLGRTIFLNLSAKY